MSAVAETLEIMGNAAAMQAVADHKTEKTRFSRLDEIPNESRPASSAASYRVRPAARVEAASGVKRALQEL